MNCGKLATQQRSSPCGRVLTIVCVIANVSSMSSVVHKTLTTDTEIAAYLHRTRMAILDALRAGPATSSQVAEKLGVHPANLTRHLRVLEDAGLISLVEKRDTGRNLEKYYAAVAATFDVAPEAGQLEAKHKVALAFVRSDLSRALARLPNRDPGPVVALLATARIQPGQIDRFRAALDKLIDAFSAADSAGGEPYHLNLSLYPGDIDRLTTKRVRLARTGGRT